MARFRRIVQILFLFFFIFLFLRARYPYEVNLSSDVFLRFSPLIPVFYLIDNLSLSLMFWPALLILFLTIFLGRFFCGWICPLGTTLDIWDRIIKAPSNRTNGKWLKMRWVKFGILTSAIFLAIFSYNVWGFFDPLAIFTRITTVIIYPVSTFFSEKILVLGANLSFLESAVYPVYDGFKSMIMPESQSFYQSVFWTLLLLVGILTLEKLSRRFWCRNVCPAGALLGILSQFRLYERVVGDPCPVCNRCQTDCKMNAIPAGNVKETNKVECIECFNCGEKCPPEAKSITFRLRLNPYHTQPDFLRRQFLASGAAGLVTLGFFSVGLSHKTSSDRFLRPPGSLPENEFLDRCIRCLECVRICSSNGRCLQPGDFGVSLLNLWTPVAIMREGYCEYNCNLCGLICPTDAILPLTLEVKQKTPIGLAYFDKNICIPYERNEDCLVCEEHCPTPDKAIKFDVKEAVFSDGSRKKVKYPYVVRELCIGCGICEEKCPLPGAPAIYVTRTNEKRWETLPAGAQLKAGAQS